MMNLLKITAALLLICLASCSTDPYIEETPQVEIIQADGFDINLSGTFNGEPFILSHTSAVEKNYPVTGSAPRSHISNFSRQEDFLDVVPVDQLILGIAAANDEGELLNTAFIGEHDWVYIADANSQVGKVFLGELIVKGERYRTAFDPDENPFNTFEITSVTQIDNDENLDQKYIDKLYMIEGNFSCLLSKVGDSIYTEELVIDHFSLMFINE
jgi:hypothetical protein